MNRNKKYLFYTTILSCILIALVGCKKDSSKDLFEPADEITASETILIPDKQTKKVAVVLSFKNLDAIDRIQVVKSGGSSYAQTISRQELSSAYTFTYQVQPSDPESFRLLLRAYYKDGNASKELSLTVDNRWGFFIRSVKRIARVTGRPIGDEPFPSPNNTATQWNVGGTDLGIVWEMTPQHYGIFFGDTFGQDFVPNASNPGPNGSNWRSNVLAFSNDINLDRWSHV